MSRRVPDPSGVRIDRTRGRCVGCGHLHDAGLDPVSGCCPECHAVGDPFGLGERRPVGEFAPTVDGRVEYERRRAA